MTTNEVSIRIKKVCGCCKVGDYETYEYEYTPEGLWWNCPGCNSTHLSQNTKKYEFKNLYLKYNKELGQNLYKGLRGHGSRIDKPKALDSDSDSDGNSNPFT